MHSAAPLIRYFEADARTHLAAAPSPRPSSLFEILGSFIFGGGLNKVYDPGFLLQQALEPFPHGRMEVVVEGGRGGAGGGGEERLLPRRKAVSADGLVITHWKPISLNIAS